MAGYTINIFAHSQGNIVAGEALRMGAPFDNYILTQGAVPAHSYDTSAPALQTLLAAEAAKSTPFAAAIGGYHGLFTNITGNVVNFINGQDFALATGTKGSIQTH